MIDFISCIITNAFRIYLIDKFAETLFKEHNIKIIKKFIIMLAFWILNTGLFMRYHTMWINVVTNIIGICAIVSLYTCKIKNILFGIGYIYIINAGCDIVGTSLFIRYQDGQAHSQVYAIISVSLTFICEICIEKIINKRMGNTNTCSFPIIFVPICSIITICALMFTDSCDNIGIAIVGLSMVIISFLIIIIYKQMSETIVTKYETEILKQQVKVYANEINLIQKNEERLKIIQHDLRHHVSELRFLAENNKIKEIRQYIAQMDYANDMVEMNVRTENPDVDSLINYLLSKAKKILKTVESKITIPEPLLSSYEINALLANLIENAISAAEKTNDKYLQIKIKMEKGILNIFIQNSFDKSTVIYIGDRFGNFNFITTKEKSQEHGIGIKSIRQIVAKYNGKMDITMKDNIFTTNVIMYIASIVF